LDDGSACALERVAPATYAGVELEIGQGDPHCYLQSSKSIYLQWVQLGEEDPPTSGYKFNRVALPAAQRKTLRRP
jgi:hypothetical protein